MQERCRHGSCLSRTHIKWFNCLTKQTSIRAVEEETIEFSEKAPYNEGLKQSEGKERRGKEWIGEDPYSIDDEEEEEEDEL